MTNMHMLTKSLQRLLLSQLMRFYSNFNPLSSALQESPNMSNLPCPFFFSNLHFLPEILYLHGGQANPILCGPNLEPSLEDKIVSLCQNMVHRGDIMRKMNEPFEQENTEPAPTRPEGITAASKASY